MPSRVDSLLDKEVNMLCVVIYTVIFFDIVDVSVLYRSAR